MPEVTDRTLDDIEKHLEILDSVLKDFTEEEINQVIQRASILFHDVLYDAKRR